MISPDRRHSPDLRRFSMLSGGPGIGDLGAPKGPFRATAMAGRRPSRGPPPSQNGATRRRPEAALGVDSRADSDLELQSSGPSEATVPMALNHRLGTSQIIDEDR